MLVAFFCSADELPVKRRLAELPPRDIDIVQQHVDLG